MANDPTSQDDRASPQKPRRKPVTIDLPAEEVGRKPAETSAAAAASTSTSSAGAAANSAAARVTTEDAKLGTSGATSSAEGSGAGDPIPSAFATQAGEGRGPTGSEPPPRDAAATRRPSLLSIFLAGVAGGGVVAVVVGLLFSTGYLRTQDHLADEFEGQVAALKSELESLKQEPDQLTPLREQVTALQASLSEFAGRPSPASLDSAALKGVEDRLAAIESAREAAPPGTDFSPQIAAITREVEALKSAAPPDTTSLQSDVSALQSNVTSLQSDVSALQPDITGVKQQLETLSGGLAKLPTEERVAALEAKLEETNGKIASAAALAPAVAADALAGALDAGRPFASELAALKALGGDAQAIDALAAHAATGLPTIAALRAQFDQAVDQVGLATPIPESTGTIDRLLESARGLVEVRPARPTEGSDPGAVVARIRGALAAGDLRTALAEWNALPETIKTPTAEWAKTVEARAAADELAAQVRTGALSKLTER